jgi:hypothetical protein
MKRGSFDFLIAINIISFFITPAQTVNAFTKKTKELKHKKSLK